MNIAFSRNHNGDPLVMVDGKVAAVAKECAGYEYLRKHILLFEQLPSEPAPIYQRGGQRNENNEGDLVDNSGAGERHREDDICAGVCSA